MNGRHEKELSGAVKRPITNKSRYQALFENSADAILIIENGKFVDCNDAAVEMLRYSDKQTVLQTHPSELSPEFQPDGRFSFEKANEMIKIAIEHGNHRFEWEHRRSDGEVFPVEVLLTAIPLWEDGEENIQIHTVWRDITERKRLENQLRHSQKMEAIGKLSSGIAHDFNNQLVPILGYCELLSEHLADNEELQGFVNEINRAGNRATELIKKLMVFSHKKDRQEVTIDLSSVLDGLISVLGQIIGEDISLVFSRSADALPVVIDPVDLEQIILNMATNARDAMPQGGEISITLELKNTSSGNYACLNFCDTGEGMDEQTRQQVFTPFFTTKNLGAGTGLGMSGAYELITKAEGSIRVTSTQNKGSCFNVMLPISKNLISVVQRQEIKPAATIDEKFAGLRHILVVEDDSQIIRLTKKVLTQYGYQVSAVTSGEEALSFLGSTQSRPNLILCDVVLSGMSGPFMINELKQTEIQLPVLFMSGHTNNRLEVNGFAEEDVALIHKPFTPSSLLTKIKEILN